MKKYVAYYNRKTRELGKKFTLRIHIIDVISLAFYLPLVILLDTYAFDCKNISCKIWRELFTRLKLTVIIFRSCHGESGK